MKEIIKAKELTWKKFIAGEKKKAEKTAHIASHTTPYDHVAYMSATNVTNPTFFGEPHDEHVPEEKAAALDALQNVVGHRLRMDGDAAKSKLSKVRQPFVVTIRRNI